MPLRAAVKAVADALADPANAELTAEEVAERAIDAYEAAQAKTHNLIVLGHFRVDDDTSYVAAVGPLSTRATAAARGLGERFAWDYKTRKGTGKFVLVPLIRNVNEAWDEARREALGEYTHHLTSITPGVELSYEPMRFDMDNETLRNIKPDWTPDPELLTKKMGPVCICGLPEHPRYNSLGDRAQLGCPQHPEGRSGEGST